MCDNNLNEDENYNDGENLFDDSNFMIFPLNKTCSSLIKAKIKGWLARSYDGHDFKRTGE